MTKLIGIRREDKDSWEKRVPLIPSHLNEIVSKRDIDVLVQPSSIRIFTDEDYVREGIKVEDDLKPCSIVFAIKEIPLDFFERGKVYLFFSHTIKGQSHNMPMLKKMIELGCTLIDYETIVNEKGQRLLFFGRQAGQAGMIDTLAALGQRLSCEGKKIPLSFIKQAISYASLVEAKEDIEKVGWEIKNYGLDPSLVPMVFGFAGYGQVSLGAQDIFDLLPFENIAPEEIDSFFEKKNYSANRFYKVVFKEEHLVEPVSPDQKFELQDYYDNPQKYRSIFDSYVPYLTVIVNCVYWAPQYPRFVTKKYLKQLYGRNEEPRLRVIGDITCDIDGSIECTVCATSIDNPVFVYDPLKEEIKYGVEGRGPVVMAIDNLPAEISRESSIFFSKALKPFVAEIAQADFSNDFESCNLPYAIKKAVILFRGSFTPDYGYMKNFIK